MFGKKNDKSEKDAARAFEDAKDATRRATFLNAASQLPQTDPNRRDLVLLARTCRAAALASGKVLGKSEADVDAEINSLFTADIARLKAKPDRDVQEYARESYRITKAFLATIDPEALAATTQRATKH